MPILTGRGPWFGSSGSQETSGPKLPSSHSFCRSPFPTAEHTYTWSSRLGSSTPGAGGSEYERRNRRKTTWQSLVPPGSCDEGSGGANGAVTLQPCLAPSLTC